jgi:crotonobetainyl-CoA:carnitine CoA-transferase CaiB-like acyl-CoA transferase
MSMTGSNPDEPVKVGVALVDVITGLHASVGVLAALNSRAATGLGQRVEVNLLSSLLSGLVNQSSGYAAAGFVPGIMGNRHPSIAPYESYPTASAPIVIAVGNDGQFQACMRVLGDPERANDPRFTTNPQRVRHREELFALMTALLKVNTSDYWFAELTAAGVPCGPINDLAGAFALATELGLSPIASVEGVPTVGNPIGLSATPVTDRHRPPELGHDNDQMWPAP